MEGLIFVKPVEQDHFFKWHYLLSLAITPIFYNNVVLYNLFLIKTATVSATDVRKNDIMSHLTYLDRNKD